MIPLEIAAARLYLSERAPYLSTALFSLTFHPTKGLKERGVLMASDKWWRIYYDEEAVKVEGAEETAAKILHEMYHLLLGYWDRMGSRTPKVWNVAHDLAINPEVRAHFNLTQDVNYPSTFDLPEGLTAEEYYDRLYKEGKVKHVKCACGVGIGIRSADIGGLPPPEGASEGVDETRGELIRREIAKEIRALPPGSQSRGLERWAESILTPKVPWGVLLSRFIRESTFAVAGMTDYTYAKLSRKSLPGVRLPAMLSRKPRLGIIVDTSGSMSEEQLGACLTEIKGIGRACGHDSKVWFVDAAVCSTATIKNAAKRMSGRGGTDMRVGIDAACADRPKPDVLIVLTDGWTPWPETKPRSEVIVCLVGENGDESGNYPPPKWSKVVAISTI